MQVISSATPVETLTAHNAAMPRPENTGLTDSTTMLIAWVLTARSGNCTRAIRPMIVEIIVMGTIISAPITRPFRAAFPSFAAKICWVLDWVVKRLGISDAK